MTIAVTGGGGYIGSHVARLLRARGDRAVVIDDLSTGHAERVEDAPLVRVDLADSGRVGELADTLRAHGVRSIIHLAARKRVDESVSDPVEYYRQNVGGLANLLAAMNGADVAQLVFSSSAAVYASAERPVREDDGIAPGNPYGATKLVGEWLVRDWASASGGRAISLRYFNVAGASDPVLADRGLLNLVPLVYDRIERGERPRIYGDAHLTPDGTCVRDYVHVQDVAEAHLVALDELGRDGEHHRVYNVGTGTGRSVREMVERMLDIAGSDLEPEIVPARPGDAAFVVADSSRIADELGWSARLGIDDMLESSWRARGH